MYSRRASAYFSCSFVVLLAMTHTRYGVLKRKEEKNEEREENRIGIGGPILASGEIAFLWEGEADRLKVFVNFAGEKRSLSQYSRLHRTLSRQS